MAVSFDDYFVIGISSRALFDLEEENRIFESEGLEAYSEYQYTHEKEVLKPGAGFSLIKNLLEINESAPKKLVEVIVMSRNSAETSLRIIHSLEHYHLDVGRMVMSGGEDISRYLTAFGVNLFLSCNEDDVSNAVMQGFPAGLIIQSNAKYHFPDNQIRIAFDADAVIFSSESEKIYQTKGLEAFVHNEVLNQDISLRSGPMAKFLFSLSHLQQLTKKQNRIRTAIVTARDKNAGIRIIKTLRSWKVTVDEVFFLQGANKTKVLECFGANLFFDDQDLHLDSASQVVPSAKVPYIKGEEPK